eukprot:6879938-Ditylum_brightwellii.AAC.1
MLGLAVEEQADIGWDNFVKGHVSTKWCKAQHLYSKAFPMKKEFNGNTWMKNLIKAIWTIFVDTLAACNADLHMYVESASNSAIDKQVRKSFTLIHSMLKAD